MPGGFFLVFEGIDKCGKSTQASLLQQYLEERGVPMMFTREPGGTALGEKIRSLLLDTKDFVDERAELLLYEASRAQHVSEKITPALKSGKLVLCDRFTLATSAYQGAGRGIASAEVERLNRFASFATNPDLTVVLDIPVDVSMRRIGDGADRMEKKELLQKVRSAYRRLAKERKNIVLVSAQGEPEEIHQRILKALNAHLKFKKFVSRHSREGGSPQATRRGENPGLDPGLRRGDAVAQ